MFHSKILPILFHPSIYDRLLGFDKLVSFAVNEWIQDIKKTQVPCLLGGVGPMHALVQLCTFVTVEINLLSFFFKRISF